MCTVESRETKQGTRRAVLPCRRVTRRSVAITQCYRREDPARGIYRKKENQPTTVLPANDGPSVSFPGCVDVRPQSHVVRRSMPTRLYARSSSSTPSSAFTTRLDMDETRSLVNFNSEETRRFFDSFDTVLTDCDGVLWFGNSAIEGSMETLKKLKAMGKRILFVSNNSTLTLEEYCEKFRKFGYATSADDIAVPSRAMCWYLKSRGFAGKAFVLGTETFRKVLRAEGIDVAEPTADFLEESFEAIAREYKKCPEAKAVIVDLDININWVKVGRAIRYLRNSQVLYVVGSADREIPVAQNVTLLGTGVFIDLITKESNREPVRCGKPSEVMKNYVLDKFGLGDPGRCIFIGDSLENDMKFADLCGFAKLWVGSGIDSPDSTPPKAVSSIPDYYLPSLGLLLPLLDASSSPDSACCSRKSLQA